MTIPLTLLAISLLGATEPRDANTFTEQALTLVRRARGTAATAPCVDAARAVEESLKIEPGNFGALRARVAVLQCQGRWTDALAEATALNQKTPDDVVTWGYIADEQTALGNYEEAARAAQWMVNMRQLTVLSLPRGAALKEVYGYVEPALEWWNSALETTPSTDLEGRAWLMMRIAGLDRTIGRNAAAIEAANKALALRPDYPWALDELGLTLASQKEYPGAIEAFQKRSRMAPSPATLYQLAKVLAAAGRSVDAASAFAQFEKQAIGMVNEPVNANLELVEYYSGAGKRPDEAVRIAQLILKQRHPLEAYAAYAGALAARREWKAAGDQMNLALRTGVKNPAWLLDAGRIAREAGDSVAARKYFQEAIAAAPASPIAEQVIAELVGAKQ